MLTTFCQYHVWLECKNAIVQMTSKIMQNPRKVKTVISLKSNESIKLDLSHKASFSWNIQPDNLNFSKSCYLIL